MRQIICSPKVEKAKACELVLTIHSHFKTFQNQYLPLKECALSFDDNKTPIENCEVGIVRIRKILLLLKDFILYPTINKVTTLLELAKLTHDLVECVLCYVDLLE